MPKKSHLLEYLEIVAEGIESQATKYLLDRGIPSNLHPKFPSLPSQPAPSQPTSPTQVEYKLRTQNGFTIPLSFYAGSLKKVVLDLPEDWGVWETE